jgi:hypothetical protein
MGMFNDISTAVEKLVDKSVVPGLLAFLCGFALLAVSVLGALPPYGISIEPLWRALAAGIGLLLLIAGMSAYAVASVQKRPAAVPGCGPVTIMRPVHRADVLVPFEVTGKAGPLPTGFQLWLFNIGGHGNEYYPQSELQVVDGEWSVDFKATTFEKGHKRKFAIFLVGPDGQVLLHFYKASGKKLDEVEPAQERRWPPLTQLTSDISRASDIMEVVLVGRRESLFA